jgi:putative two-component system response regulator
MSLDSIQKKVSQVRSQKKGAERILIVDDEVRITQEVKGLLESEGYEVQLCLNGRDALASVKENPPDLVMTDLTIRYVNGFELCRQIKEDPATKTIPVIMITGLTRPNDKIRGIEAGVTDFIAKPFDPLELKTRIRSALQMKNLYAQLENIDEIIVAFSRAVEARDAYTRGHSERVGKYAIKLAAALGFDTDYQMMLFKGAILHDIGKIGVRDSVLLKKGKLDKEEYEEIKTHPAIGLKICSHLKSSQHLLNIIAYHHERMDGHGYPYRLFGEEIPIEARIAAIADTFDALTSARPYRDALTTIAACHIIEEGMGSHFDEDFAPVFIEAALRGELREVVEDAQMSLSSFTKKQVIPHDLIQGLDFLDTDLLT